MPLLQSEWDRAISLIPNGTMTLSKTPSRFVDGVYPKMLSSAVGCTVWDNNARAYTDYICGLGPIILGYNDKEVNSAVIQSIYNGQVILSLPHEKEAILAESLKRHIKWADQFTFFKTGSDALSAAVKVCRAHTGKEKVLVCGYHGWHDWYTIANDKKAGIPKYLETLVQKFKYNDLQSIEDLLKKGDVAAVVLEPLVYDEPKDNFLLRLIPLCHKYNALCVFDEVVTGIRFGLHGAAGMWSVVPDLACYSKALGNGFPIATLAGKKEFMSVFERGDFFVSGTFGGDLVGISAALAVIKTFENNPDFITDIWENGKRLAHGFNRLAEDLEGVECVGFPPRTMFKFPTDAHKALFWQECIKRGVLFGYANFISAAHTQKDIDETLAACKEALRLVKDGWYDPKAKLEGKMPLEVFRLVK